MNYDDVIKKYNSLVKELTPRYESVRFEDIHGPLIPFIPDDSTVSVLDIGCGTGRDAAWFARKGHNVVAIEPGPNLLAAAQRLHSEFDITWIQDKLPALNKTIRLGMSFDIILMSAVWMHIKPDDRARVFRKLVSLLKPGGIIAISLRHGPHRITESVYPVSKLELEKFAIQRGLVLASVTDGTDQLNREGVKWETVILRLPDDGTGALPLLRHIISKDRKSSTYKLALLRCLVRIAESARGLARYTDDYTVSIPLGLVALYWIRIFKPLIDNDIPQSPDKRGLGFVKEPFHALIQISPFELRVGVDFHSQAAGYLNQALKDAARTIKIMPANCITYPNSSEQIFKISGKIETLKSINSISITDDYLWSFGKLSVPLNIWNALSRYSNWIEPSLLFEWSELMQQYADSHDKSVDLSELMNHLRWLDPEHDTKLVRKIVSNQFDKGIPVVCVWSGGKIKDPKYAIDHCLPFTAFPCNDLWNLLPSKPSINSNKSDKLVTSSTLVDARPRIETWWKNAYFEDETKQYVERFRREALASLPLSEDSNDFFDVLFEGVQLKRASLKQNLNLVDWN